MKRKEMAIGIGLVVLGLVFLLGPSLNLQAFGWPFFVIIPGVVLLFISFTSQVGKGSLAVPGAIVTVTGLILLVLNLIGRMDAWAYAWALVMAGTGAGTYIYGSISDSASLKKAGSRTTLVGLILFAAFGLVFELFIFGTFSAVLRWVIPVALLAAGGWLLYQSSRKPDPSPYVPAPGPVTPTPSTAHPPVPPPAPGAVAPLPPAQGAESDKH